MRFVLQLFLSLTAGVLLAWGVSSCGSGENANGTVATKAQNAATSATVDRQLEKTTTDRKRDTASAPTTNESPPPKPSKPDSPPPRTVTETRTVTAENEPPPEPKTRTKTVTSPAPPSTTITNETTVKSTTEESDGLPWWGWLLIVLGVAAIAIGMYLVGRRRRRRRDKRDRRGDERPPPGPPETPGPPDEPGPPDDGIPNERWPKPPSDPL